MKIRNAELCDLPYLLEMLENAKASLRALGIDQWQNGYPNETTLREDIQNKICRVVIDDENTRKRGCSSKCNVLQYILIIMASPLRFCAKANDDTQSYMCSFRLRSA